jgi:two-component system OmpR family response regulator
MRAIVISCLVILLAGILCTPGAGAQSLPPNYDKILQIHLDYQGNVYSVSSVEVRYGKAPNLDIISGPLEGTILDSNGNVVKSFSFQGPGTTYGIITGTPGDSTSLGYTETSPSGAMIVTLPYLAGMQKFTLSDSRDGALLASVDLGPQVTTFCTDYPRDPDCLVLAAPLPSAEPSADTTVPVPTLLLSAAACFAAGCIAAGIAVRTIRRRTKKVVLIVDDEPGIVEFVTIFLNKKGFATLNANSGAACLDILKKQIPDLILLDVRMVPMDGWQTLGQIKKNPGLKSIPVLMLTGSSLTAELAKRYNICIDDYITKPFKLEDLHTAINSVLMRKQNLKETLSLARKAGIEKEKFCELATLTRRISVNRKLLNILDVPQAIPTQADLDTLDDMLVVDYMNVKTRDNEKRAEQLRQEINSALRQKGFPELGW